MKKKKIIKKDNIGSLFDLLGECSSEAEQCQRSYMTYKVLRNASLSGFDSSGSFGKIFDEYYAFEQLDKLNIDELRKRNELMTSTLLFRENISKAITCGNAYELSESDMPDLMSEDSIRSAANKLKFGTKKTNFTNIKENEELVLFDASTIRSAEECYYMMPASVLRSAVTYDIISKYVGDRKFCVSKSEMMAVRKRMNESIDENIRELAAADTKRKKHLIFKLSVFLIVLGVIFFVSQFSLFSQSFTIFFAVFMLIVTAAYLIWG